MYLRRHSLSGYLLVSAMFEALGANPGPTIAGCLLAVLMLCSSCCAHRAYAAVERRRLFEVVGDTVTNDKWKATFHSIDQPGPGMNATAVTKDGSTVRIVIGG